MALILARAGLVRRPANAAPTVDPPRTELDLEGAVRRVVHAPHRGLPPGAELRSVGSCARCTRTDRCQAVDQGSAKDREKLVAAMAAMAPTAAMGEREVLHNLVEASTGLFRYPETG